jgi:SAM-dependent methyltransferase
MMNKIKQYAPWWGKIAAKLVLHKLPLSYGFWQNLGVFRHGRMDSPDYAIAVFEGHVARAGLRVPLQGMTILEIGPGDSISTAIIAKSHGAKAILVDVGHFAEEELGPYLALCESLRAHGLKPPDISSTSTLQDVLLACNAEYLTEGLVSWEQIPSGSVDFAFSQSVLECIYKNEFLPTMQECRRVMRPNSIASHTVDLRDLLGNALNNLRFSERVWESNLFRSSGFYSNRIRYSEMLDLFKLAGFAVEKTEVHRWEKMPTPREKLVLPFRNMPEDELRIWEFNIVLRVPSLEKGLIQS